jgi:hypothetical protein
VSKSPITTVRHLDKNTVVISPAPGWSVTIFNVSEGKFIDAFVTDGSETIKLSLEGPDLAYGVKVQHDETTGETHVIYVEKPRALR